MCVRHSSGTLGPQWARNDLPLPPDLKVLHLRLQETELHLNTALRTDCENRKTELPRDPGVGGQL